MPETCWAWFFVVFLESALWFSLVWAAKYQNSKTLKHSHQCQRSVLCQAGSRELRDGYKPGLFFPSSISL